MPMIPSTKSAPLQRRGRPVFRAAAVAAALALLVTACGDDDDTAQETPSDQETSDGSGSGSSGSGAVEIIAEDIDFGEDDYQAEAGEVSFVYENQGSIVHTLLIRDVDDFELEVTSQGDVDEGSVELEAGEYELYCNVPGHEVAGMVATLVVE